MEVLFAATANETPAHERVSDTRRQNVLRATRLIRHKRRTRLKDTALVIKGRTHQTARVVIVVRLPVIPRLQDAAEPLSYVLHERVKLFPNRLLTDRIHAVMTLIRCNELRQTRSRR